MNRDPNASSENRPSARELFARASLRLPGERVRDESQRQSKSSFAKTSSAPVSSNASFAAVKAAMHTQLLEDLDRRDRITASEEELTGLVEDYVADALETQDWPINDGERRQLVDDLIEETIGVGPLAPLLADPAVTDILVNGPYTVFVERFGQLEKTDVRFRDNDHLVRIIGRIAARVGRRIDESSPMVDARLPDGSRVNATLPPVTIDGPTLSIRRFGRRRLRSDDLLRLAMFSPEMIEFLRFAIRGRINMIVSGGTGSGKSTFLGAMAEAIPDGERIITIEDAAELQLDQLHVVRMETRPPNIEGEGRIVARDLVVNALRMAPRSNHCWRSPRGRGAGHDAGYEHGSRRFADDDSREFASRCDLAFGNHGFDGRHRDSCARDSRTGSFGDRHHHSDQALRGWDSPRAIRFRIGRYGRRYGTTTGDFSVCSDRKNGSQNFGRLCCYWSCAASCRAAS